VNRKTTVLIVVAMLATLFFIPTSTIAAEPVTYKVTFLMADSPEDNGWNAAHWRGIQKLKTLGELKEETTTSFTILLKDGTTLEVSTIQKIGYNQADIERMAQNAIERGANLIFGTWFDSALPLKTMATQHPDVLFEHGSGYPMIKNNGVNLSTYFIKQEQGDYVAGYVIGRLGISRVGLVGTFPIPEPVRGINGFTLGLQRGLKEAGLDPTSAEVQVVWIYSWLDAQKEQLAAEGLTAEGFKVIRQMADTPYSSQAACQEPGVLAVGYGTDVTAFAPCSVVSNEWNWGDYYVTRVQEAIDGTWKPQDWWGGFEADAIIMAGWNDKLVSSDIRAAAEQIAADIKTGFDPFCGPISGTGLGIDGKEVRLEVPVGKCLSDMDLLTQQWFFDGVKSEFPPAPPNGQVLELR
jgi:basic membrane protein A and related proteins